MALIQLDFFKDVEVSVMDARMDKVEDSLSRQRKAQFAKIGELKKEMSEMKAMLNLLVENICKK